MQDQDTETFEYRTYDLRNDIYEFAASSDGVPPYGDIRDFQAGVIATLLYLQTAEGKAAYGKVV